MTAIFLNILFDTVSYGTKSITGDDIMLKSTLLESSNFRTIGMSKVMIYEMESKSQKRGEDEGRMKKLRERKKRQNFSKFATKIV